MVHLLRYIRGKNNLGLKYYVKIEYTTLSDFLIQARINTENQLMVFYYSIWKDCSDNIRSAVSFIFFYQGGPIDHFTHVPGTVSQWNFESGYNAECTLVMDISHLRVISNELLNKDPDVVPKQTPLIIFDNKWDICKPKICNDIKHTRHIFRIINFVING